MFPRIRLDARQFGIGLKVESVSDYLNVNGLKETPVDGQPWSQFRAARIANENDTQLWIVERHGYRGFTTKDLSPAEVTAVLHHDEAFHGRRRRFEDEAAAFAHAEEIAAAAKADLGADRACDMFFHAEREYWMGRNRAGRLQRARQDALGLGWGNHDHHTLPQQPRAFPAARRAAGIAGHVLPRAVLRRRRGRLGRAGDGTVRLSGDGLRRRRPLARGSRRRLRPRSTAAARSPRHGRPLVRSSTAKRFCKPACTTSKPNSISRGAREQLAAKGIKSMDPFTDFPFLRQSFTQGEIWPVEPKRIAAALAGGYITREQADKFATYGAIGSHLEVLERNDGYKGFNQTGISHIIRRTDPRAQAEVAAASV